MSRRMLIMGEGIFNKFKNWIIDGKVQYLHFIQRNISYNHLNKTFHEEDRNFVWQRKHLSSGVY